MAEYRKAVITRNGLTMMTSIPMENIEAALLELAVTYPATETAAAIHVRFYEPNEEYPDYGNDAICSAYLAGYQDGQANRHG